MLSHDTALDLHDLCDINPAKVHITVPRAYRINREIPPTYAIHHRDLAGLDRTLIEGIPAVTPARSIEDAIDTHVDPKLIDQAIDTAQRRGLIRGEALADIEARARQAQSAS